MKKKKTWFFSYSLLFTFVRLTSLNRKPDVKVSLVTLRWVCDKKQFKFFYYFLLQLHEVESNVLLGYLHN